MKISNLTKQQLRENCGYTNEGINAIENGVKLETKNTKTIQTVLAKFLESEYRLILLTGTTGIGKSYIVQKESYEYFRRNKIELCDTLSQNVNLKYCFHYDIKLDDIASKSYKAYENCKVIFNKLCYTHLLIIDEFCEFDFDSGDLAYIENVIKKRYGNNAKTILISNRTIQELAESLSKAFIDRLFSSKYSTVIELVGESLRNGLCVQNNK